MSHGMHGRDGNETPKECDAGVCKNLIGKGRVRFRRGWAVQSGDPEKAGRKTHGGSAKWIAHPGAKMV